ncbi:MAG TPA: NAD(P)/FAD-dependent oxidoreductase [Verrucomicrobiae bacterium]|nr:NAD(P)/FAD-dependent oxidoreductase [Verrucomicrobiae bacterium]
MPETSVVILGAGVAGLSAANELAQAGVPMFVLEARQRVGGRIFTVTDSAAMPVELGAEFIHGRAPELWQIIQSARLPVHEVPERHLACRDSDSKLTDMDGFWEGFERIIGKIDLKQRDEPFSIFLSHLRDVPSDWKKWANDFVEGFDAAHTERISIHALAREESYSERIEGDHSFRIATGYSQIVEWLARQLELKAVPVHCGMKVETVRWKQGGVTIQARDAGGRIRRFQAARAVITLPLGVLKSGDVQFEPEVKEKRQAIEGLEMGEVVKVNLRFRSRFWPEQNFGFIHACDDWFPTWWSHEEAGLLTGWAGGPKAERMAGMDRDHIIARALDAVAGIFKVPKSKVKNALDMAWFHDWTADPFSRGAYSYIPAGMMEAQQHLSWPVRETLFFAGEAATLDGQLGTVHGAIGSGKRAAHEVLQSMTKAHG